VADVAHQLGHVEDHGAGIAGLHALAVHVQPHVQPLQVLDLIRRHQPGTDGAKGVATLALVPLRTALELVLALADVVDDAIAGHIGLRILLRHVAGTLADDDAQLHLPVALGRATRQHHRIVRALNATGSLHEDHRLLRDRHARLRGVIGEVQADRDELVHLGHRAAKARGAAHQRQLGRVGLADAGKPYAAQLRRADVGDDPTQVAQTAVKVDQARLFLARVAIANQLHFVFPS